MIALQAPDLVRRMILAGTGPRGGEGIDEITKVALVAYLKAALTLKDSRNYLFFPRTPEGKRAAKDYFGRLKERKSGRDKRYLAASKARPAGSDPSRREERTGHLSRITQPVFVANGDHDLMVDSSHSADMARRLPNARLTIYPDSGHGGVFQHHQEFVPVGAGFPQRLGDRDAMTEVTALVSARFSNFGVPVARYGPPRYRAPGREVPVERRPEGQHHCRPASVPARRGRSIERSATSRHVDVRAAGKRPGGIGSAAGSDSTPNWYKNLMAAGGAEVQVGGERWSVSARELEDGAERNQCWSLAAAVYPGFDSYQRFTDRRLPVAVLEHVVPAVSFAADTAVCPVGPGRYTAELHERWSSLVGIHGGYTAAIVVNAITAAVDDPT